MELGFIRTGLWRSPVVVSSVKSGRFPILGLQSTVRNRCCRCTGVTDFAAALSMNWRPALDEVLLMSSILLAYVAGVADKPLGVFSRPRRGTSLSTNKIIEKKNAQTGSTETVWNDIRSKLTEAVSSMEIATSTERIASPKLCLQALGYGPRLKLLLTSLSLLRNEVEYREGAFSLGEFYYTLAGNACRSWLSEEGDPLLSNSEVFNQIVEYEAKSYITTYIERSGKAELYTDFFYFLCNKSLRAGSSLDAEAYSKLASNILEDIVIVISEGAAVIYLAAILAADTGWPTLLHPSISSTRWLERFRNEVAMQQWVHDNFDSVASIYEDRIELWTLKESDKKTQQRPDKTETKKRSNAALKKRELDISPFNIRLRRNKELKALSGWRYYYSLYLEFSDIVGPVLRMVMAKLRQGLSFLLVCLIGRSFGLIYQGIRQSLKWSSAD